MVEGVDTVALPHVNVYPCTAVTFSVLPSE